MCIRDRYDAARREAREEIDVGDLALDFLTAMQRTRGGEPIDERIDFFFGCRSWSGTPRIVEPAKCADLRWFSLTALPDPVVPHELTVLHGIIEGAVLPYTTFGFPSPGPSLLGPGTSEEVEGLGADQRASDELRETSRNHGERDE